MESAGFFEAELLGEIFQNDMVHGKPCINGFRNGPKPESSRRSSRIWQRMRICRISVLTAPVSKPIKQVQVQKKRNPDVAKTAPKVDGNRERFEKNQCIGITRGGRNTKIHAVVDALGNPIHVQLSSGDIHDSVIAEDVLNHIELKPNETTVLADKAYGSFGFREYIANRDTDFCIPPKSNTVDPWYCDWFKYKERHLVECFFNKLKENRRIATRFDKLASRFLAFVHIGCIRILLA